MIANRYRLLELLGSGGMGRVWRAHDQQLGVDVAIKEALRRPGIPDGYWEEFLVRAGREARHGARLRDHPNIVTVFDVVIEGGIPWTVMRLVKGTSLEVRLDWGRLSVEETAKIAAAVLSALGAAHEAGIIHRDVKPANIMLADDGAILLTDFGIAINEADTKLTQDGGIVGSMAYIAPERAGGDQGDEASDLFSLGVTLYQATEGTSPFQRDTLTGTLRAVAFHEPPPPAHAGYLAALITALLRKEPGERPTVAEAIAMTAPGTEPTSEFDLILKTVGSAELFDLVGVVMDLTTLSAREAVALVTSAPQQVLGKVDRGTAVAARDALVALGATVSVRQYTSRPDPEKPTTRILRSPASKPKRRRLVWVKAIVGLVAVAATVTTGIVINDEHTRPDPQAKDLLQKIDIAQFIGLRTDEIAESDYADTHNWQGSSGKGYSEHVWGDNPEQLGMGGGTWAILVDVYHYGSAAEASLNSRTYITEYQRAIVPFGASYHALTAPSSMTAMATSAYHPTTDLTYEDLEIVDGPYRVRVKAVLLKGFQGGPSNDISQLAALILPHLPPPPALPAKTS
ncbi:hypothetical protein BG452_04485 [Streptomyces sp. CBMA123]|nr:hypothetical protein [Streptomyces sp. CBMA123]